MCGSFRHAFLLALAGLAAGAQACAPLAPYNPDRLPAAQMSRIGEICHTALGLPAGPYAQYLACEESLSHSAAAQRESSARTAARQACAARGFAAETDLLAQCELQAADAVAAQADAAEGPRPSPGSPAKSYFSASNDEIHRRVQHACADIGEDPATRAFAECVVGLHNYLFDADNPMRWGDR